MSYRLADVMNVWLVGWLVWIASRDMCDYAWLYVRLELASGYAHITLIASFVCLSVCLSVCRLSPHSVTSGLPPGRKFPFVVCTCLILSVFLISSSHRDFPYFSPVSFPFPKREQKSLQSWRET